MLQEPALQAMTDKIASRASADFKPHTQFADCGFKSFPWPFGVVPLHASLDMTKEHLSHGRIDPINLSRSRLPKRVEPSPCIEPHLSPQSVKC